MKTHDLIADAAPVAVKAAVGAGAAAWNAVDGQVVMSIAVGAVTVLYLVVQVAYLAWKWRRNSKLSGMVP